MFLYKKIKKIIFFINVFMLIKISIFSADPSGKIYKIVHLKPQGGFEGGGSVSLLPVLSHIFLMEKLISGKEMGKINEKKNKSCFKISFGVWQKRFYPPTPSTFWLRPFKNPSSERNSVKWPKEKRCCFPKLKN